MTAKSPDGGSGDTAPPMLVSSTPAAGATGVSRMATIQLVFDKSLDPASVTPQAFVLGCWACMPVFTTPTYDDATRTVTLVPMYPMDAALPYELIIGTDLHDVAGNAFAGATIVFHTRVNAITRLVNYNSNTGVPTAWTSWTLDGSGAASRVVGYNGPGADGVWFTADDVMSSLTVWMQPASGSKVLQTSYTAGADGKLGTSDDVVYAIFGTDYNSDGNPTAYWSYDGPGPDGLWATADDHVYTLTTIAWDGQWMKESDTHSGPGADGQWNTADDPITRFAKYEYDARHREVREVELSAGADQHANTADDAVTDYWAQTFDAQDRNVKSVYVEATGIDGVAGTADDGIGPDGMWFTADDIPSRYTTTSYDASTLAPFGMSYIGPGPDHVWMTADDVVDTRYLMTYDARRLPLASTVFSAAGADGQWGTSDDVTYDTSTNHFDGDGLVTDSTIYGSPGADGVWHTADDRPSRHYDYDDTH